MALGLTKIRVALDPERFELANFALTLPSFTVDFCDPGIPEEMTESKIHFLPRSQPDSVQKWAEAEWRSPIEEPYAMNSEFTL